MRIGTVRILAACSVVSVAGTASATGIALTEAPDLAPVALPAFDLADTPRAPAVRAPAARVLDAPVTGMQIASLGVAPAAAQTGRVEAARAMARERRARERAAAEARAARERAATPAPVGPAPEPPVADDEDAAPSPDRAARPPRVRSLLREMCADEALPASFCRAD
ncbi:hypothetical protein [Pseudonocardia sp. T1-2H]|uniref:hypothetical protein n=1 Tax=Pseudonocardia sp. T1-2H TaxID=3128899 RepID=UPI003100BDFB